MLIDLFLFFLLLVVGPVAYYFGYLSGLAMSIFTIVVSIVTGARWRKRSAGNGIFRGRLNYTYRRYFPGGKRGFKIFLAVSVLITALFGYMLFMNPADVESPLVSQKLEERNERLEAQRRAFGEHRKVADRLLLESAEATDPTTRRLKLEQALGEVNSAAELSNGEEKTQLLNTKTTLLFKLGQTEKADETFHEYVQSGGQRIDFPRALYDQGLNEQAMACLKEILAKRRPCEAGVLEALLLFRLGQEAEGVKRFQNLRCCNREPGYDELEARVKEYLSAR